MKAVDVEPGATVGKREAGWRSAGRTAELVDEFFGGDDPLFVLGVFDGAQNRHKRMMWACSICGPRPSSRGNWCDAGCGRDYQKMIEIECKDSYDYNNGYDYGRYLLCFQNPTLFLAITKEGPDKVLAPFEPPSPEVAAKIPPKVRRVRYNIYGEEEEDDEDD